MIYLQRLLTLTIEDRWPFWTRGRNELIFASTEDSTEDHCRDSSCAVGVSRYTFSLSFLFLSWGESSELHTFLAPVMKKNSSFVRGAAWIASATELPRTCQDQAVVSPPAGQEHLLLQFATKIKFARCSERAQVGQGAFWRLTRAWEVACPGFGLLCIAYLKCSAANWQLDVFLLDSSTRRLTPLATCMNSGLQG